VTDKIFLFVIGLGFLCGSFSFPPTLSGIQSAAFWPRTLAVGLLITTVFPARYFDGDRKIKIWNHVSVLGTLALCVLYFAAWYFTAFIPATLAFVFSLTLFLRRDAEKIASTVIYSVICCALFYVFFHLGMRVPL
jgi:hypothetical protein